MHIPTLLEFGGETTNKIPGKASTLCEQSINHNVIRFIPDAIFINHLKNQQEHQRQQLKLENCISSDFLNKFNEVFSKEQCIWLITRMI